MRTPARRERPATPPLPASHELLPAADGVVLEAAVWLVTALIVLVDLQLPTGYAISVLYVGVVLAALGIPRASFLVAYGVVASVLTVVGYLLSPPGGPPSVGVFNRVMSLGALWVTVGGLALYQRTRAARQQAERELREQASFLELAKMAAAVAHETRNTLMALDGALQGLNVVSAAENDLSVVQDEARKRIGALTDTIDDLMVFTQVGQPAYAPARLDELVAAALEKVRARINMTDVDVRLELEPVTVSVDGDRVKRVIFNLILNAIQAMGGRGSVNISARLRKPCVELRVVDSGPGIPSAVRRRLFEPFFSTKSRGIGVGLAFARRVIEMHGGSIDLTCPPNGGTDVLVTLPA